MASSNDYIDRLRDIRDKYGISQTNSYSEHQLKSYSDHQQVLERNAANGYLKSQQYGIQKKKITGLGMSPSFVIQPNRSDYGVRPQSSLGLSQQSYVGVNEYPKKIERERQINQLRDAYVANRKKVVDDFSAKNYSRNYSKDVPRVYPSDFTRQTKQIRERDLCRDYSQGKEDFRNPETVGKLGGNRFCQSRKTMMDKSEQYASPIKRMTQYEQKKSHQNENPSDNFWREREAKLSELTSNKLNESQRISLFKDQRSFDYKPATIKRAQLYTQPHMKSYSDFHTSLKMDLENKPSEYPISTKHTDYSMSAKPNEYSISNIDRIQQRIQSILGKR